MSKNKLVYFLKQVWPGIYRFINNTLAYFILFLKRSIRLAINQVLNK